MNRGFPTIGASLAIYVVFIYLLSAVTVNAAVNMDTELVIPSVYDSCMSEFQKDDGHFKIFLEERSIITKQQRQDVCSCVSNAMMDTIILLRNSDESKALYQQQALTCFSPYINEYARRGAYDRCVSDVNTAAGKLNFLLKEGFITSNREVDEMCSCVADSALQSWVLLGDSEEAAADAQQKIFHCIAAYIPQ